MQFGESRKTAVNHYGVVTQKGIKIARFGSTTPLGLTKISLHFPRIAFGAIQVSPLRG